MPSETAVTGVRAALQSDYQRSVDTAHRRRQPTAVSDRDAREQVRNSEVANRRHREQIAAERRGGLDVDA